MGEKKSKPKSQTVRSVVFGALPPLAYLLRPEERGAPALQSAGIINDESDWAMITPITRPKTPDFPLLPALTSSSRALGSLISAFKGIPDAKTWPMTSESLGVSQMDWNGKENRICVPVSHLDRAWEALPGSGGSVKALEWHRDTGGVGHESVVLEIDVDGGPHQTWYVCVERYPDGDFATISPNKTLVLRPKSEIRAEMEFTDGLPFAHVLRVLDIIEQVSPHYFLVGSNCWFYASMIVEMLDQSKAASWKGGRSLKLTDHSMTKGLNYKQHFQIEQRVKDLLSNPTKSTRPGSWCNILLSYGSGNSNDL